MHLFIPQLILNMNVSSTYNPVESLYSWLSFHMNIGKIPECLVVLWKCNLVFQLILLGAVQLCCIIKDEMSAEYPPSFFLISKYIGRCICNRRKSLDTWNIVEQLSKCSQMSLKRCSVLWQRQASSHLCTVLPMVCWSLDAKMQLISNRNLEQVLKFGSFLRRCKMQRTLCIFLMWSDLVVLNDAQQLCDC